jgi:A/G-specific adenine glycosylase
MDINIIFRRELLEWFENGKRKLPWRDNNDWYKRWISEIMLQQTQVEQVINYFNAFIMKYPSIQALAQAPIQDILKIWEGLGYYSRARNLHKAAQIIYNQYNCKLPSNEKQLKQLPGFGTYTTHAILSIVFNQPYAVVDGNVLRVITRIYAIKNDIRLPGTHTSVQNKMNRLLDEIKPGEFNEALMELGATICLPKNPCCECCPVRTLCKTVKLNLQDKIPFKSPPPEKPHYTGFTYILYNSNQFYLVQRPYKGLLAGLWEFPTFTLKQKINPDEKSYQKFAAQLIEKKYMINEMELLPVKHSYTHFNISIQPYLICISKRFVKQLDYDQNQWVPYRQFEQFAMHRAMRKIILKNKKFLEIVSP